MQWDDLKLFVALARAGSVRAAATTLGVHHSTVTRRLEQFEAQLGMRLFDRTPEGLKVSALGERVLAKADRVEAEIAAIERLVMGHDERLDGSVRITFPDAMGVGFLVDELARFVDRYPGIALEFISSNTTLNLGRREADVAIRVTREPPEHLVGRRLGAFALAVYASRRYLDTHDPFVAQQSCSWIGSDGGGAMADELRRKHFPNMPSRVSCANVLLQLAAVASHGGLALLPCALADTHGSLVRVVPDELIEGPPIWLLMHPDLRNTARVQAVARWITAAFARNEDLLMGLGSWDKADGARARSSIDPIRVP